MTPRFRTAAAAAALALVLAACGADDEPLAPRDRPIVVATTTQLGDIVRQVAGDAADVHQILQANTDPHVKAIFPESSLNPSLAEALARETGARADAALYGDTLGPAGSDGETYLKMEAANADAMVEGFTGGRERC